MFVLFANLVVGGTTYPTLEDCVDRWFLSRAGLFLSSYYYDIEECHWNSILLSLQNEIWLDDLMTFSSVSLHVSRCLSVLPPSGIDI